MTAMSVHWMNTGTIFFGTIRGLITIYMCKRLEVLIKMRYITFIAVLLVSGLTACAGAAKKSQVTNNTPYRFSYNPTSMDDLNLVVSSVERTPVGEVMIPKTTDLESIVTIAPILILDGEPEETDERD